MVEIFQTAAAILLSSGVAGVVIVGLSSWLGKVWANRILEQDRRRYGEELERLKHDMERASRRLQGDIDKTLFVHRIHFEAEFRALRQVWRRLSQLRNHMATLRPMVHIAPHDDTPEKALQRLAERFNLFSHALNEAITAVDDHRPFLSEEIHSAAAAALRAANAEYVSLKLHPQETTPNWYDEGQKNMDALLDSTNSVVNLIRARLQTLAVIERQDSTQ